MAREEYWFEGIPRGQKQRIANTGEGDLVFLAICTPRFESRHYEEA